MTCIQFALLFYLTPFGHVPVPCTRFDCSVPRIDSQYFHVNVFFFGRINMNFRISIIRESEVFLVKFDCIP